MVVYDTSNGERPFIGASSQDIPLPQKPKVKNGHVDPFWFREPVILVQPDRLIEFVPFDELRYVEKLNAIMRFSIYAAVVLLIYRRQPSAFLFPLFVAGITLYMYKYNKIQKIDDHSTSDKKCTHSTLNNPHMNVLMSDYAENPHRPPACKEEPEEMVQENFRRNLYRNAFDDIYNKTTLQRHYTMPVTDIEQSDYKNYINWLHNVGPTCKTDNSRCAVYEDVRYKRRPIQYVKE